MPIITLLLSTLSFWMLYWFIRMGGLNHVHGIFTRRKEEARGRLRANANAPRPCVP
jgi:hypothetical protein